MYNQLLCKTLAEQENDPFSTNTEKTKEAKVLGFSTIQV